MSRDAECIRDGAEETKAEIYPCALFLSEEGRHRQECLCHTTPGAIRALEDYNPAGGFTFSKMMSCLAWHSVAGL